VLAGSAGASGPAAAITAAAGGSQEAAVSSAYAAPLQARVTDASGDPVPGAQVSFDVVAGPTGAGAMFPGGQASATTDANGVATSPPLLANAIPGRFTAYASVDGVSAVASYSLDNHAAVPTVSAQAPATLTATAGARFRSRLHARVLDASGQPLEGVSVTFTTVAASGGADGAFVAGSPDATVLTDANGEAASPALRAGTTAGRFTATASVTGARDPAVFALHVVATAPVVLTAGAASGESTLTRTRFRVPLAVTVADRYGNPVAGALVAFAAPRRGPSGTFRSGRIVHVRTRADGVAVAPRFTADAIAGGYIVTATVDGASGRAAFALVNAARA
jgi:protocatechuate 3,4-dioxygenase beta subunit